MSDTIVVDTDILIDAGRGIDESLACIKKYENQGRLAVSIITKMELVVGCCNKNELIKIEKFLNRFELLNT